MFGFVIFISIFLTIYFIGNFYILWRLFYFFSIKRGLPFYILLLILGLSFLASNILQSKFPNALTRIFYIISASWMGIGILLISILAVFEVVNLFIKLPPRTCGIATICLACTFTVYSMINAQLLRTTKVKIKAPVDAKIVQLSDIHLGSVPATFLKKIVNKTNSLEPDIVLITGDLVDAYEYIFDGLKALNQLNAPIYFVIGNHERYAGIDKVMNLLKSTKVIPLRNETVHVNGIQLIGIDDGRNGDYVANRLKTIEIDETAFTILMYHRPDGLQSAADKGIDLVLSGHTHKGQIFPVNFLVRIFYKNMYGLFKNKNTSMYVSCGTGTWGPRMRLGSKSEIVVINLVQPKNTQDKNTFN